MALDHLHQQQALLDMQLVCEAILLTMQMPALQNLPWASASWSFECVDTEEGCSRYGLHGFPRSTV